MSRLDFSTLMKPNKQLLIPLTKNKLDSELLKNSDVIVICDQDHQETYLDLLRFKTSEQLMIKLTPEMVTMKVILLMRDQNRVSHVDQHLRTVFPKLQISPAVDAMTPHAIDDFVRTYQTPILKPIRAGKIGCLFSHLSLWKDFLNSNQISMLVMEDDIIPTGNFDNRFEQVLDELPPTFDLLYLHLDSAKNYDLRTGSVYSHNLKKNVPREDTCAYLISRKGASKLVDLLKKIRAALGTTLMKQIEIGELETYTVKNALFTNIGQKTCNQDLSQGLLKSNTCHSQLYVPDESVN